MTKTAQVLVIDPDPDVRMTLEYTLGQAGMNCLVAKSATEGLQKCFGSRPSVVLTEIAIGEMDGYELCGKIKGEPTTRETTKVVFLTSHPENEVLLRGPEVCADFFVRKPFHPPDLLSDLQQILSGASATGLRVSKRVPTHKESITPGYSSSGGRVVHINPPEVRFSDKGDKRLHSRSASASNRPPVKDERLVEVNELLQSLVGSFKQTRDQIEAVVSYLDEKKGRPSPSKN